MRKVLQSESPKRHFNLRPNLSYPRCPDSRLCSLCPMLGIFSWRHNLDFSRVFVQRLQHLLSVLLWLGESNVELFLAHFLPVQRPRKVLEPGRNLLSVVTTPSLRRLALLLALTVQSFQIDNT